MKKNHEETRKEKIMRIINKLAIITPMIIIMGTMIYTDIDLHERVHKKIFEDYGINATIVKNGFDAYTTGMIPEDINPDNYRFMQLAHEMNEIESYNNTSTKIILMVILFMIVCNAIRD
jgi:hypothetical protein